MSSHENPIVPYANKAHDRERRCSYIEHLIYGAAYIQSILYIERLIYEEGRMEHELTKVMTLIVVSFAHYVVLLVRKGS